MIVLMLEGVKVQSQSCNEMIAELSQHLTYIVDDERKNLLGYVYTRRNWSAPVFYLSLAKSEADFASSSDFTISHLDCWLMGIGNQSKHMQ